MNNHHQLLVGTSKGNIFMVDPTKNPNETSKDARIFVVRPTKENGPIAYVTYGINYFYSSATSLNSRPSPKHYLCSREGKGYREVINTDN